MIEKIHLCRARCLDLGGADGSVCIYSRGFRRGIDVTDNRPNQAVDSAWRFRIARECPQDA